MSATVPGAAERAAECALPSCAANVAAVADADGAAKWRADAAADGRAFVTLVCPQPTLLQSAVPLIS